MRRLAILVIVAITSMSSMAAAQTRQDKPGACSHAPAIMAAADFLLAEPAQFPNFWRDRYGDDAAYLKIRYGDLTYAEGSALLVDLEKRSHPPQRIAELRLAYAKAADRAAMIAGMQPQPNAKSILPQLGLPALRVLVIEDGGDWLLGELGHLQTLDLYQALDAAKAIAGALSVLDDEAKSQFAQRAENAGVWPLALEMRAVKDDLSDYVAYLDKLPPHKGNRTGFIRNALYSADLRPSFDISKQPAEVQALDRQNGMGPAIRQIGRLIDYAPQAAILLPLVNQTGDLRLGTTVAAALNAQIAGKQLDPVNDPDAVTTAMLDGIDDVLGHRDREDNLRHALIFEMAKRQSRSSTGRWPGRRWPPSCKAMWPNRHLARNCSQRPYLGNSGSDWPAD